MLSESLKIQKNHCAPDGYTQRQHHHAEVATPSKCCLLLLPDTLFKLLVTNAKLVQVSKIQTKYHAFGRLCQPCHAEGTHLLVHFFTAPAHLLMSQLLRGGVEAATIIQLRARVSGWPSGGVGHGHNWSVLLAI